MKKNLFTLGLLALSLVFVSCGSDDDDKKVTYQELPATATTFLVTHFTGEDGISKITKDNDSYDVYYVNYKVEFYIDGEWEGVDGNHKGQNNIVPASVLAILPAGILEYVEANYSNYSIVEVDKEKAAGIFVGYEIQLNDSKKTELDFDTNGNFLQIDK